MGMSGRIVVDGKHFACGADRFHFRGVTYGTFRPREDGARYPDRQVVKRDFADMAEAGFTVVRTYTPPPDDVVDLAADWGLRLFVDIFYPDWRYLLGNSRRERQLMMRDARAEVQRVTRRFADNPVLLGLSLGNEVPADAVRWFGTHAVAGLIDQLADVVHEEDGDRLVTYANYPTTEYLPLQSLDFLAFNVFLEHQPDFRRYLTRLHHLAGDRPLVLSEMGIDSGVDAEGEDRQRDAINWQLETALERGVAGTCIFSWTDEWWVGDAAVDAWHFGLTRIDRSPRPALHTATTCNQRTVADLDVEWPSITVVICAYNAAASLDECLRHCCALDYPALEIMVVDDGSSDATASIASQYPRARVLQISHAGLSAARNAGLQAATGQLIAYLDSDAYPTPEWLYYLALGVNGPAVVGVGGPNIPPPRDPSGARLVAHAPGGPAHVLVSDDRAEHIPGCNMAFWRDTLLECGGFDPIYTTAGDDVDICWRVQDRGLEIAFHPAAHVWHHRRNGLLPYLRQQHGYGQSEALVEARHPDRFTAIGSARWRGVIYQGPMRSVTRQRVYRGQFGTAAFQSVYRGGGQRLDVVHQIGVPLAVSLLPTGLLAVVDTFYAGPAIAAVLVLLILTGFDLVWLRPPPRSPYGGLRFRMGLTAMHLLQPLVRTWGRARRRFVVAETGQPRPGLPGPMTSAGRSTLVAPFEGSRGQLTAAAVGVLKHAGLRVAPGTGWEDFDARFAGGLFVVAELLTSDHVQGWVQLRIRRRPHWPLLAPAMALAGVAAVFEPLLAVAVVVAVVAET
jgi:O-antigen biosynthesis protein